MTAVGVLFRPTGSQKEQKQRLLFNRLIRIYARRQDNALVRFQKCIFVRIVIGSYRVGFTGKRFDAHPSALTHSSEVCPFVSNNNNTLPPYREILLSVGQRPSDFNVLEY